MNTRNKIGCFSGVLAAGSLVWFGVYQYTQAKLDKSVIEEQLSKSLGVQVRLGEMQLAWSGRLQFGHITLSTPTHSEFGKIEQAVAQVDTSALWKGQLALQSLSLDDFKCSLDSQLNDELSKLPKSEKPRTYPISINRWQIEYSTDKKATKWVVGPILAKLPALQSTDSLEVEAHADGIRDFILKKRADHLEIQFSAVGDPNATPGLQEFVLQRVSATLGSQGKIEGKLSWDHQMASAEISGHYRGLQGQVRLAWAENQPQKLAIVESQLDIEKLPIPPVQGWVQLPGPGQPDWGLHLSSKAANPGAPIQFGSVKLQGWDLEGKVELDGKVVAETTVSSQLQDLIPKAYADKIKGGKTKWQGRLTYNAKTAKSSLEFEGPLSVEQVTVQITPAAGWSANQILVPIRGQFQPGESKLAFDYQFIPNQAKQPWITGQLEVEKDLVKKASGQLDLSQVALQKPPPMTFLPPGVSKQLLAQWPTLKGIVKMALAGQPGQDPNILISTDSAGSKDHQLRSVTAKLDGKNETWAVRAQYQAANKPPIGLALTTQQQKFELKVPKITTAMLGWGPDKPQLQGDLKLQGRLNSGLEDLEITSLTGTFKKGASSWTLPKTDTIWKRQSSGIFKCEKITAQGLAFQGQGLIYDPKKGQLLGKAQLQKLDLSKVQLPVKVSGSAAASIDIQPQRASLLATVNKLTVGGGPDLGEARIQGKIDLGKDQHPDPKTLRWEANIPKFDLAKVPQSNLTGTASLKITPSKKPEQVLLVVNAPHVQFTGKGKSPINLGSAQIQSETGLSAATLVKGVPVEFQLPKLGAKGSGKLQPLSGSLDIRGQLENLNLASFSSLLPKADALTGLLTGKFSISGKIKSPKLDFSGKVSGLKYRDNKLPDSTLQAAISQGGQAGEIKLSGLPIAQLMLLGGWNSPYKLSGKVDLSMKKEGDKLAGQLQSSDLQVEQMKVADTKLQSDDLKSIRGTLQLDGQQRINLSGTLSPLHLVASSERLQLGSIYAVTGPVSGVQGWLSGKIDVKNDGANKTCQFDGQAFELKHPRSNLGSAKLSFKAQQATGSPIKAQIEAKEIEINQIGLVGLRYPGMTGKMLVTGEAVGESASSGPRDLSWGIHSSISQIRFQDQNFPDVALNCQLKGDTATLNPLKIKYEPPIELTGTYGLTDGAIRLYTELKGHSLMQLCRVLGLKNNEQVQGLFTGPLTISGSTASPSVKFEGSVQELQLRGVAVGAATLNLTAQQQIDGTLIFAQPVDAAAFGQLAGISGIVKVTGIRLKGTTANPVVDPILAGPKIDITQNGGTPSLKVGQGLRIPLPFLNR